jgi:hypothetical protein
MLRVSHPIIRGVLMLPIDVLPFSFEDEAFATLTRARTPAAVVAAEEMAKSRHEARRLVRRLVELEEWCPRVWIVRWGRHP